LAPRRVALPFIGASNKAHSSAQQSGRTINLYPEVNSPDAKAIVALRAAPGSFRWRAFEETFPDLSDKEVRGCHSMGSRAFWVVGNRLFEVYPLDETPQNEIQPLATLNTSTGFVGISDNAGKLVIGDGKFWTFDFDAAPPGTGTLDPVLNEGEEQLLGYYSVYEAGTTLYALRGQSKYAYSAVGNPSTVEGLWYMGAEIDPDPISAMFQIGGDIPILGPSSTEIHRNYGDQDPDNPWQRIPGARFEIGVVGKRACCKADNAIYMVGQSKQGAGQVYRVGSPGQAATKVSNQAVEEAIAKVLYTRRSGELITMWAYQEAGHTFVLINLPAAEETVNNHAEPSQTWVFDTSMPPELGWHQRGYRNPATGRFERGLADMGLQIKGQLLTGSYNAPHIYLQSLDFFRESGDPLVKLRESAGPLNIDGHRFTVHRVGIEMEVGVGRDGDALSGQDPQIILQFSWDKSRTWSDEIFCPIGPIGEGLTEVVFGACGSGKDFTIRVICSEAVRVTFTGAWADVSVGR
jgi:hypothetical protein